MRPSARAWESAHRLVVGRRALRQVVAAHPPPTDGRTTGEGTAAWHEQTRVTRPDGTTASVDVDIAPLILRLWADGFDTVASCQDGQDGGWTWVRFADEAQASRFAASVSAHRDPLADGLNVTFRRAPNLSPLDVMRAAR